MLVLLVVAAMTAAISVPAQGAGPGQPSPGPSRPAVHQRPPPTSARSLLPRAVSIGSTWTWQNPLPNGHNLNAIDCPAASTCIAVGDFGVILASADAGSTWIPQISGTSQNLYGIHCLSATTCYVVGAFGSILETTNAGSAWSALAAHTASDLYSISCGGGIYACVAVGNQGVIAQTADGTNWSASTPWGTGFYLAAVDCTSGCVAVGQGGFSLWATTNGWYTYSSGTTNDLFGLSCRGACLEVGAAGTIVRLNLRGPTGPVGTVESSVTTADLYTVNCAPATSVCIAGGVRGTMLSSTDGASWATEAVPTNRSFFGVTCVTAFKCAAVGESRTILTVNRPVWAAQASGTGYFLRGVSCPSPTVCFAVGDSGTIIKTSDGGGTWSAQTSGITTRLNAVSCPSISACFAAGAGGTILATTDGSTWSAQISNTAHDLLAISCPSTAMCVAVGAFQTIDITTNGGTAWSATSQGNDLQTLMTVSCPSSAVCYAISSTGLLQPQEYVFKTTDGGTTWAQSTQYMTGVTISCPTTSVCDVGESRDVLVTTDGGSTWYYHAAPTTGLRGSSCPSAANCVMVGGTGSSVYTTDGSKWLNSPTDITFDLTSVSCPVTTVCFAVGGSGTVVYTADLATAPAGWTVRSPIGNTNDLGGSAVPALKSVMQREAPERF